MTLRPLGIEQISEKSPVELLFGTRSKTGAIKAISRSEMTALISGSLIRRGAELARRRVEIAASRMA